MKIGTGTKEGEGMRFAVEAPGMLAMELTLERGPGGDRQPDWVAKWKGEKCGAFWRRVPNAGGEAFLSGVIESPVFSTGKLEVAIFPAKQGPGQMEMVWRPKG